MRLRKLYDHQYLSRAFLPTIRGSSKAIYFLGHKGIEVIAQELGIDPLLIQRKVKEIAQLKEIFLTHSLEINEVRINFSQAIQNHSRMSLESWINDNDCQQEYRFRYKGKEIIKKFRPDGYFRLLYEDRLYSFFLELDRSTMSQKRFKRKVQNYLEFAELGFYRERFGVQHFQVLVITLTLERLLNLKKSVEAVTDKFFWFTTLDQATVEKIFYSIWYKAGLDGLHPLIRL